MRWIIALVGLALLAVAPFGSGAPVDGPSWSRKKVAGGSGAGEGGAASQPGTLDFTKTFLAGQRACVIVIGDHDPVVDLEIQVFDAKGNLVAQDKGQGTARDYAAVMWYPPRQEPYRIVVSNYGSAYNVCSIAVK